MLTGKLDPLTEQQVVGIYGLQHSSQQAEEALTQGLDQLQQSLVDTIAVGSAAGDGGVHHMAMAIGKLANLEGFVRQVSKYVIFCSISCSQILNDVKILFIID